MLIQTEWSAIKSKSLVYSKKSKTDEILQKLLAKYSFEYFAVITKSFQVKTLFPKDLVTLLGEAYFIEVDSD